jgi:hypothetical protein
MNELESSIMEKVEALSNRQVKGYACQNEIEGWQITPIDILRSQVCCVMYDKEIAEVCDD